MKPEFKNQLITGIITLLLFFLLFGIIILYSKNIEYKKQVETERLKQDSLMGAKQLLDKEFFMLEKKFDSLKEQNEKLEKQLSKSKK